MDLSLLFIICPLVFFAGFVDSVAGGGGIISLTSYLAVGMPVHLSLGTNKFSSTCGLIVSSARYVQNKKTDPLISAISVLFALVGSYIGASVVQLVDQRVVTVLMIAIIPVVAFVVLKEKNLGIVNECRQLGMHKIVLLSSIIGLAMGFYDGFFGPGTGTFLIMLYAYLMRYDLVTASGNAKLVNLASNLGALVSFLHQGNVYFLFAIPAAICGIAGSYIGSGLAIKGGAKIIRTMLIVVLILLVVFVICRNLLFREFFGV